MIKNSELNIQPDSSTKRVASDAERPFNTTLLSMTDSRASSTAESDDFANRRFALRALLSGSLLMVTGGVLVRPGNALAASAKPEKQADRRLRLVNVHTAEEIDTVYWSGGHYTESGLREVNHLMRDHRANEVMQIDPRVLDFLNTVQSTLGEGKQVQILSGYRSPKTNALLAKKSSLVAKNSLHMTGRAIDFRIPGVDTKSIRTQALESRRGGVGYYPKSDFLHIDSGPVRHWG